MAVVMANVKCFVDNVLRKRGDVFEYFGELNSNLKLIGELDSGKKLDIASAPVVAKRGRPSKAVD